MNPLSYTTYSFLDLAGVIAHPSLGAYTFTGEGVGEIQLTMAAETTVHDVAADGTVMISKIAGENGSVAIRCQQTSTVHKWLLRWYDYLRFVGDTSEWAQTTAILRNTSDKSGHTLSGISPQKKADMPYQKQGQIITWTLMCADIRSAS